MLTIHSGTPEQPIREAINWRIRSVFPVCSPKYRFTHKTPWECRPQFSRCIISISLSHHLLRMANTHGPDSLSIFHLKNLGPLATEHLTALYNKTSLVIPIPKPGKDSSQGTSYRPISLLCPAAKVLEVLILPSINKFLSPAKDQHGFTVQCVWT